MFRYVLRRLAQIVPVLVGVSILVFALVRLIPGDVVDVIIGNDAADPAVKAELRQLFGLDQPIYLQYLHWVMRALRGDLGVSLRNSQPVSSAILHALPVTIELAILSLLIATAVAIPLGIASALRRNSGTDLVARLAGLIGLSFPNFWLATMLILVASRAFQWLPAIIFINFGSDPVGNLKQMILPALSLAAVLAAIEMRMTRSSMLEVLRRDFVKTARSKGVTERMVMWRHALKNALIPVITVVGVQLGYLLGGAVIVEQIFGLPGIGWLLLNGVYQRDYPMVQAATLLLALFFILTNLLVDITYAFIDPRIRYA